MGHRYAHMECGRLRLSYVLLFLVEFRCLDIASRCEVHDRLGRARLVVVVAHVNCG